MLGTSANGVRDGRYRGNLEVRATALGGVSAINAIGIEDYVRGVVAGEMPSGWPQEALRAQAVAARTYALATSKDGDGFDQYADTRSQVYNGIAGETAATDAAVAATASEIVAFAGKPIATYFFSTSGGRTENVENVFIGAAPAPYLTSVEDPYDDASPRHTWVRQMSLRSAQRRLGSLVKGSLTPHPRAAARAVAACRLAPRSSARAGARRSAARRCAASSGSTTPGRASRSSRRTPRAATATRRRSPPRRSRRARRPLRRPAAPSRPRARRR